MKNCLGEMFCNIRLLDRDGMKICPCQRGHLRGNGTFVIVVLIEGKGERLNWSSSISRRKSEHRAGINPAAKIAADRDVSAHPQAHRLLEHISKLFDPRCLAAMTLRELGRRAVIQLPILMELHVAVARQ